LREVLDIFAPLVSEAGCLWLDRVALAARDRPLAEVSWHVLLWP
jgi:hypothetical protein